MSTLQPLYIEASDEITTVVERLQEHEEPTVLLVAPKGAAILQSIVNLKLIKKAAKDAGKHVILITTDKIGRNLAIQVGLEHAANVDEAEDSIPEEELQEEAHVISGVRIHRYYEENDEEETDEAKQPVDPIVPKKMMQEKKAEAAPEEPIAAPEEPIETEESAVPTPTEPEDGSEPVVEQIKPKTEIPTESESPKQGEIVRRVIPLAAEETRTQSEIAPPSKKKGKRLILISGLVVSLILISGGLAFLYLPKTDVTAQVPATPWKQQYNVTAAVNPSGSQVAAKNLTAEESQTLSFRASGTKELGEKAHGTATAFNSYSSDPQKVPAGTTLSAKGLSFTTDTEVTVPGARVEAGKLVAGSINVAITAVQPGPDSNMENVTATPSATTTYFQVVSTTGGTSRTVAVITDNDINTAKSTLTKNLQDAVATKLSGQMKNQDYLSDSSTDVITVDAFKYTVKAGDESDSGQVSGKANGRRMVISNADIESYVQQTALANVPNNTVLKIKDVKVNQQNIDTAKSQATFSTDAYGTRSTHINTDDLPQKLAGKTFKEGTDLIHNLVQDKSTTISYLPPWWPRAAFPSQSRFIHVHIVYE